MAQAKRSEKASSRRSARSLHAKGVSDRKAQSVRGGKPKKTSSAKLYEAACKGTHIPEVVIE
jgi:hypothetical protein